MYGKDLPTCAELSKSNALIYVPAGGLNARSAKGLTGAPTNLGSRSQSGSPIHCDEAAFGLNHPLRNGPEVHAFDVLEVDGYRSFESLIETPPVPA